MRTRCVSSAQLGPLQSDSSTFNRCQHPQLHAQHHFMSTPIRTMTTAMKCKIACHTGFTRLTSERGRCPAGPAWQRHIRNLSRTHQRSPTPAQVAPACPGIQPPQRLPLTAQAGCLVSADHLHCALLCSETNSAGPKPRTDHCTILTCYEIELLARLRSREGDDGREHLAALCGALGHRRQALTLAQLRFRKCQLACAHQSCL